MTVHTITLDPAVDILGDIRYAGGKGILTAHALVSLGIKNVSAYAFVGGKTGEEFNNLAKRDNLKLISIPIKEETRVTKIISMAPEEKRSSPSPKIQLSEFAELYSTLQKSISAGDYVVISGRVPKGLPTNVYGNLIDLCKSKNAYSILDASQVEYAIPGLARTPYLMKGNEVEWTNLGRSPSAVVNDGVTYSIITMGSDGCRLYSSSKELAAIPPRIQIKSTVGSGDCLTAGFIYGLKEGKTLEQILSFAVACGSVAAKNGAARCSLKEAEEMQKEVKIVRLDRF